MTSRIAYNNPDTDGTLGLPYHYEMLSDRRRLRPLRRAIRLVAKGKRVLESGTGSGVLSILAAKAGARRVYAVEKDPVMARFARQNVQTSGCGSIVRVIEKDTRSVTLNDIDGERVDVVIAEHLSTWQVTEPQISVMNHVNLDLASESRMWVPECAFNLVELVSSRYQFEGVVELRVYYFGFTGIRRPTAFSAPTLFQRVDFSSINETVIDQGVDVEASRTGTVNGLRLTSPLRVVEGISFRSSDSLMPPVVVPLEKNLEIRAGDVVRVRCRYRCETNWSRFDCEARRVSRQDVSRSDLLVRAGGPVPYLEP